jgi:hypothetical protein
VQEALSAFTRWSAPFPLADHRLPAANPAGLVSENEIGTPPCRLDLKSLMQPRNWSGPRNGALQPKPGGLKKALMNPMDSLPARSHSDTTPQWVDIQVCIIT